MIVISKARVALGDHIWSEFSETYKDSTISHETCEDAPETIRLAPGHDPLLSLFGRVS